MAEHMQQPTSAESRHEFTQTGDLRRLALRLAEAAQVLGMSDDSFARHVRPFIRTVRCDRLILVPVKELEDWIDQNAVCALGVIGREQAPSRHRNRNPP
jgi:hypothetical protein